MLVHLRMADRESRVLNVVEREGGGRFLVPMKGERKKTVYLEEEQSDWHQIGRKRAYQEYQVDKAALGQERERLQETLSSVRQKLDLDRHSRSPPEPGTA